MDGFWFVFVRLRVTAEPETIQPISNNSWGTAFAFLIRERPNQWEIDQ
jgi:hypothetical protein